jgi:hypothetical protein
MEFDTVLKIGEKVKDEHPQDVRLAIVVCSSRDIKPQTNISLVNITGYLIHKGFEIGLTQLDVMGGVAESLISAARQRKLDFAFAGNYTHLFLADDDMEFPYDTVHRLMRRDKDVVFANVAQKTPGKLSGVCLDVENQKRINSAGKTGLEEVSFGTLACTLIKLDAIRNIPKPHFEVLWNPELNFGQGGYVGEDHYFFRKMKAAGLKFWCDHDLTKAVTHVGDFPYKFE